MRNFKRILKTVSLFLAVIIVLSVVFGALYLRGENYDYQDYRERDALAGEPVTEEDILFLERKAFMELCGNEKTLERIKGMVATGKPVRN